METINKEEFLNFLREEIVAYKELEFINKSNILHSSDPLEEFDLSRIHLGHILAFQKLIKRLRNLNEREFQLELKKGTL